MIDLPPALRRVLAMLEALEQPEVVTHQRVLGESQPVEAYLKAGPVKDPSRQ